MKRFLLFALCLCLLSCGGGGSSSSSGTSTDSSSSTEASLSASNADQAADAVLSTAAVEGLAGTVGQYGKNSGSSSQLRGGFLGNIYSAASSVADRNSKRAVSGKALEASMSCSNGGIITLTGATGSSLSATFSSCSEGTVTMDGTMTISYENSQVKITISGFTYKDTANNTSLSADLSLVYSGVILSGSDLIGFACLLDGSISGALSGTQINESYDSLSLSYSLTSSGVALSMSGAVKPSCLGGWITLSTSTPLQIPLGGSCPLSGDMSAAAGGNSIRLAVSSDGSISVYFNDVLIQTYSGCGSIQGRCS